MDAILLEFVLKSASEAIKSDLGQKILVFLVAWWMVKGTIKRHLEKIEEGLQLVATNVNSLKDSIDGHNARIVKIETDLKKLNGKVFDLAKGKE